LAKYYLSNLDISRLINAKSKTWTQTKKGLIKALFLFIVKQILFKICYFLSYTMVVFCSAPSMPGLVDAMESVFASVRDHTSVEVMSLPLKDLDVTIVRVLPSADHFAVDLL